VPGPSAPIGGLKGPATPGRPGERRIGIVIEPTPAAEISLLLLSAYGLAGALSRVVALVIRGHSTRHIVEELHISVHTIGST